MVKEHFALMATLSAWLLLFAVGQEQDVLPDHAARLAALGDEAGEAAVAAALEAHARARSLPRSVALGRQVDSLELPTPQSRPPLA